MAESAQQRPFRTPDGVRTGLVWIVVELGCFGRYGYDTVSRGVGPDVALVLGVLFSLVAVPELLPADRRRVAGAVRLLGIGYALLACLYIVMTV